MTGPPPEHVFEPLRPEPNAMEVCLLAIALTSGLMAILTQPEPLSVEALLGPIWAAVWQAGLIGGALVAAFGIFWRGRAIVAIGLQELGYVAFSVMSFARVAALVLVGRGEESYFVTIFAIATAIRVVQLEIKLDRHGITDGPLARWRRRHG